MEREPEIVTNAYRAERARKALAPYMLWYGEQDEPGVIETAIVDFLADLNHYMTLHLETAVYLPDLLERGYEHFEAELGSSSTKEARR